MRRRHAFLLVLLASASACQDRTPLAPSAPDAPRAATTTVTGATDFRAGDDYICLLRGGVVTCLGKADEGQPIGVHRAATGTFVQMSVGQTHVCALRDDGVAECFGSSQFGEAPPVRAASVGSFTAVSAGNGHSCGVRTDGIIECWGLNDVGQAPPTRTAQTGKYTDVSAAANTTCGLRDDGKIECFGYYKTSPPLRTAPSGVYVKFGASVGGGNCALTSTGVADCWGVLEAWYAGPYVQVAVGGNQVCALRADGGTECWGYPPTWEGPRDHNLTQGATPGPSALTPAAIPWAQIAAGDYHSCGLRSDGYFECFGLQSLGSNSPAVPPGPTTPKSSLYWGRVRVDWPDVNSNELRTEVQRSVADAGGGPTTWSPAGTVGANIVWFRDSLATPGATYIYRIRVCNNAGCSDWSISNPTRYPASVPPAPSVTANGYVCGYASCGRAAWTEDIAFVDSFRIQRRENPGPRWGGWHEVARQGRETTEFNDYGLDFGTRYQYRVAACNILGCSAYTMSGQFVAPRPDRPAAPASLSAYMLFGYMTLVWGDVANETLYELQYRTFAPTGWGAWQPLTGRTENVTEDDEHLPPGVLYQFRIRACNPGGCSMYTTSASVQGT
jgi:hypothetical protein